jgi:serine/threonine-protein kinase
MGARSDDALFICYSHTDLKYREQFSKFLGSESLQHMKIFSDAVIESGDEWQKVIMDHLTEATAALVLVSQDFMISPFIQQVELRELLASHIRRGLRLFLVPVRATNYQGTYLERFQWARPPDKPLSLLTEPEQEAAMVEVCLKIAAQTAVRPDAPSIAETIECLERIPKLDLPSVYELEEPVGEGQFARCYKAHDRLLDRKVIIKVLRTELSRDSPAYDKYVRSASRLNHRNILGLLFSQANKLPHFIVTPAVGDTTLASRMSGEGAMGPPTFQEAVRCTIQLADTLAYAHRRGCVHGRLRPGEIRFDADGEPVLSGFRTLEACRAAPPSARDAKMSLDEFVYSSPEHRDCGVVDEKTDQYMLGLIAYEMISGNPPVRASSWASVLDPNIARALLHPPPLHEVAEGCSARVSDVVMQMLSVDPRARWDSLDVVSRELEDAISETPAIVRAKESYRRCAADERFCRVLYEKLFEAMPEIRGMFVRRSMEQQHQMLRDALWLLLAYPETRERADPTILSGIARTHAHFEPRQFDLFSDAVLSAVLECDPEGPLAAEAWRQAITPGFEYLKSKAGKAAETGA